MRVNTFIILVLLASSCGISGLCAQEVCDNGVDDNGNGLVDLYDTECECNGIHIPQGPSNQIPNPDFESMGWCPTGFAEMGALDDWGFGNQTTPDYINTCGFVVPAVYDMNLAPFPNGNGVLGLVFLDNHKETASVCLNDPFLAGYEYTMTFRVASVPLGYAGALCNNGVITYPAVDITLYGHPDCSELWVNTSGCPSGADPDWIVLGTVNYSPAAAWSEVTLTFTPSQNIGAIMIGPPCNLPSGYNGSPCTPYFLIDDFMLDEVAVYEDIELLMIGGLCQTEVTLDADIGHSGGVWQWYFSGAALAGQNNSSMEVAENGYQSGMYAVTYSYKGECASDSVWVDVYIPDTTYQEVFLCPGNTVFCAGQPFIEEGVYDVFVNIGSGCDSLVQCTITAYDLPQPTSLEIEACWPASVQICDQVITSGGPHTIYCNKSPECDSIVELNLTILHPQAKIQASGMLSCDTLDVVTLNGTDFSPDVAIEYLWNGPPGGIQGASNLPVISAALPGTYCLSLTHTGNSTTCLDTACITLSPQVTQPVPPVLNVPSLACVNLPIDIPIIPPAGQQPTSYVFELYPIAPYQIEADSLLIVTFPANGSYLICVQSVNECGISDSTCFPIVIGLSDTLVYDQFTCDSLALGSDTLTFHNQYGCDSLVVRQTKLLPSHHMQQITFTCDSLLAGIDTLHLTNQYGCDSTVLLEVHYAKVYIHQEEIIQCGSGMSYADTLVITSGACDSIFITNYLARNNDTTMILLNTCDPSQAGMLINVLKNTSGCDSVVIETFQLYLPDTTYLQDFTCNPEDTATFQMLLTNEFGCDSIVIETVHYAGIDTQFLSVYTCDTMQVGTTVYAIPGLNCDTIRVVSTLWTATLSSSEIIHSCALSGPATDTSWLAAQSGCDSLHIRYYTYSALEGIPVVEHEICDGQNNGQVAIHSITGGKPPFQFMLNNGGWQDDALFFGLSPGIYVLSVLDSVGCLRSYPGLSIHGGASIIVQAGADHEVIPGSYLDLSAQGPSSWSQIQWLATDPIQCATCQQTTLGPIFNTQFVYLTVVSDAGCIGMDTFLVALQPVAMPEVYIPNSFSPNQDGINDYFWIYGNDQVISIRQMKIFDRWGNAIYARKALDVNNPPSEGWDGTFRGKTLDPGVYIYVLEVSFSDGTSKLYKGDVTLMK